MSDGMAAAPAGLPATAPQRGWRQRLLRRVWQTVKLLLGLVVVSAVLFVAIRYYHAHNRLERWWFGHDEHMQQVWASGDAGPIDSLSLHRYAFDFKTRIDGVRDNFSGLAYMPEHGQLLGILNRPADLLRLTREGELVSRHRIHGMSDLEDLVYLGAGKVVAIQEGRNTLVMFDLPAPDQAEVPEEAVRRWKLSFHDQNNRGYEGLAYDATSDSLYIAKEKSPVALYRIRQFSTLPQGQTPALEDVSHLLAKVPFLTDLSAIAFRADTGNLLLLSDESQSLVEIDAQGRLLGVRSLMPERWWDALPMPQPEGLALDADGHIYVASEPNAFYRYRPGAPF
ncbi:hypothetical protein D8I35_16900 [Corticibacter populi]|uniref:SMP-30/Gluconolactonase/LRE-like region domain-containing protein n=1 Tax=Corticibacter populi TaxID=1550736 RepID=A0A3M6QM03_9BURK|nr:SdiA-regulated domain-containing protein [Corticibacter populi]RMX03549.1 hypothetical protein D8I35_16900 [Corticibacter populi]RZS29999.1 uncharacterized protein YjiK [Corticibacter populi]